jgi:AcrR family transcriptional regulator
VSIVTSRNDPGSGQDTHERILDVAARLFVEHGYDGTSVRDIAAALGIANPSLYYHFGSKAELLTELLSEPLERVETATLEAARLSGDARTRKIIGGLLEALEIHSGIVVTALRDSEKIPEPHREIALAMRPHIVDLVADGAAEDNRDMRVTMAIGAVECVVTDLMLASPDADAFVERLRDCREIVIDLVLKILR